MKSILCALLITVLFVPMASAEFQLSGLVGAGATIVEGSNEKNSDLEASGFVWGRMQMNGETEDGKLGGVLRIKAGLDRIDNPAWNDPYTAWSIVNPYAWAWWRPIEQIKVRLGFIDDFTAASIVGWDFNGNDAEDLVARAGYEYTAGLLPRATGFYNGTWWNGASLSVYPLRGLALNVAIPYSKGNLGSVNAEDVYKYLHAQVGYNIVGIGRAVFTFTGGKDGSIHPENIAESHNMLGDLNAYFYAEANEPTFYGSFLLKKLEGIGIGVNLGFAYTLPVTSKGTADSVEVTFKRNAPMAAGLGFSYKNQKFALNARLAATFAGKIQIDEIEAGAARDPLKIGFGIVPSYDLGICKLYLNTGITYKANDEVLDYYGRKTILADDSSAFGWHINPYVTRTIGAGTVYAGAWVESSGIKNAEGKAPINWGIPVAIIYEF